MTNLVSRLKDPNWNIPGWLYNSLGMRDPGRAESLKPFYDFLGTDALAIPGDVAEFGVYKGDSILSTALLLTRLGSKKRVLGFDTFSGFPAPHPNDERSHFERLFKEGRITAGHWEAVQLLQESEKLGLYQQHQFQSTSLDWVKKRIAILGLEQIDLYPGEFGTTLRDVPPGTRYSAVLMDCDIYQSHKDALPHCWERLSPGGLIYLDEYYSLKYPGARIAVDEFCAGRGVTPDRVLGYSGRGEFERWTLRKPR